MAPADESDLDEPASSPSESISSEDEDRQDRQDRTEQEDDADIAAAPSFKIPSRTISAVEHPCIIKDLDKALATFGPNPQYQSVSASRQTLQLSPGPARR